jgi:hypothetical protein
VLTPKDESRLLDDLEAREDPLLYWGVVDGGFNDEELRNLVDQALLAAGSLETVEDVIDAMVQKGLITRDVATSPPRWRTRNGEALRLLARLRQIFLDSDPGSAWRQGAALVSDFRYARRPRSYPRRDQPSDKVLTGIDGITEIQEAVIDAMTSSGSGHFGLTGFQVRATRQILEALRSNVSTATVVGAGTGSGKTLSFYLPAFAHLAGIQDSTAWTRALAVYPRNELLKDQLNTAFATARRLEKLWVEATGRPMTIGVLNKDTPHSTHGLHASYSEWTKGPRGFRSPHLTCHGDGVSTCGGTLYWSEREVRQKVEKLTCATCGRTYDESTVVLTRAAMTRRPPDILFTTTEMLNRGLADLSLRRILGIGQAKRPRLMLLDEIHTYDGTTGAQAAMVLRRWHHSLRSPITFVGLSATLSNAVRHMADLTGVDDELVTSIEPADAELEYEGAEYLIAVRSDPTSGASVLSTTIQTAMLLPRVLDEPGTRSSKGLFGTKTFVFTDDLDVTNRLFSYLLDAEGQRYRSRKPQQFKAPLASMRRPAPTDVTAQRRAGQVWDLPRELGHKFDNNGLTVSRTTAQDAGVDVEAQLVVATASLEVGFDDPDVGAVLQHKAPRGVAAFLQRKGRAGRQRGMRPYTTVVLSDYGRDRAAYDAWDALFDPVLPRLVLPIRNRAVLRMQATIAMLDWLAEQLRPQHRWASLWRDLRGLTDPKYPDGRARQQAAAAVLHNLLRDHTLQRSLREWIQGALQIPESIATEILWHPPRSLMLSAAPTLARRLDTEWSTADEEQIVRGRDTTGGQPLPDFFPTNLFSDLALPEVDLVVPPQHTWETEPERQPMPMGQMLREYAPGRVSRRFATRNIAQRHWIPVPYGSDRDVILDLGPVLEAYQRQEDCTVDVGGSASRFRFVRPDRVRLAVTPEEIKDTSNAMMLWRVQLLENGPGLSTRIPASDPVGQFVEEARFFLHAQNAHVEVRRVTIGSDANLLFEGGREARVRAQFALDGQQIGLGATYDVDGLRLTVRLPEVIETSAATDPGLRSAWFSHVLVNDPVLLGQVSGFQLGWLHQTLECMLLMAATSEGLTLPEAYQSVRTTFADRLTETLNATFRSVDTGEAESATIGRMGERLKKVLQDDTVLDRLDELAEQLWTPDHATFQPWLRRRLLTTLGEAALWAAREICPAHDPEGVVVDVEPGFDADGELRTGQVWLTEKSIGGGGFIETLAARVRPDPRRFLRLILRATQPSTSELVDAHMRRLSRVITEDADWIDLMADYRQSPTQTDRVNNLGRIRDQLRQAGIHGAEQSVISALANRVLRPGSTGATDWSLRTLIASWSAEEERLGVEIPSRTWAYLMHERTDLDDGLNLPAAATPRQRIDAIQSMLWPRGWALRADELRSFNQYADNPPATPDLLREVLTTDDSTIDVTDPNADDTVRKELAERGSTQLACAPDHIGTLSDILVGLTTRAISTDFLQVYPRVVEIDHHSDGSIVVALELAEVSA